MQTAPDFSPYWIEVDGYCHPDWYGVGECIERSLAEGDWPTAWEAAARMWVHRLRDSLGGDYQVAETPEFLVLSAAEHRVMDDACRFYERALQQILRSLPGVASAEGLGKRVVLMFEDSDDYYRYIGHFHKDGEHPQSSGICITGGGYVHFAFPTYNYASYRGVLVHELTHGCLSHWPLPVWLNEALAMRMEDALCQSCPLQLDRELVGRHRKFWNAVAIFDFWNGQSWNVPGESSELSYNLAQVLWRKIEVDLRPSQKEILAFIVLADSLDGGESACQEIFEFSLGDLVADFLGEGDWSPKIPPQACP